MKITTYISEKKKKDAFDGMAYLGFRVRGKGVDIKVRTEIEVVGDFWDCNNNSYAKTRKVEKCKRVKTNELIEHIMETISNEFQDEVMKGTADADWVRGVIEEYHHPNINKYNGKLEQNNLVARIKEYIGTRQLAKASVDHFNYYIRKIEHFERYEQMVNKHKGYKMNIDTMNADTLTRFCMYLRNEHEIYVEHPEVFEDNASKYAPRQLSDNSLNTLFHKLNTIVN